MKTAFVASKVWPVLLNFSPTTGSSSYVLKRVAVKVHVFLLGRY